ncbi:MAG TPA: hypothetical protein DIS94_06295 [Bacteroidetes bacterium]|nr:hypothetical protein [Bacteroidota bacterium]
MIKLIFTIFLFAICSNIYSQNLKGKVISVNESGDEFPVDSAFIFWENTEIKTYSDINGKFEIPFSNSQEKNLVISKEGFYSQNVNITIEKYKIIRLKSYITDEIIVSEKTDKEKAKENISRDDVVDSKDLEKSACCDLTGCFGHTGNVEVSVSDIVTDSKELKLLGTDGVYAQTMVEGIPVFNGLANIYNLATIPGVTINSITISKGSNSVIQGYGSISGMINLVLKDYESADQLLLNAYTNSYLEKHFNSNTKFGNKIFKNYFAFNTVQKANRTDNNNDGFLDLPLITRYAVYNKLNAGDPLTDKLSGYFAFRYLDENRVGGQVNVNNSDQNYKTVYHQIVNTYRYEIMARINKKLGELSSVILQTGLSNHKQNSVFGLTNYNAKQNDFFANLMFDIPINHHYIKTGLSYRYLDIKENINFIDNPYNKSYSGNHEFKENIPGVFAENKLEILHDILDITSGVRVDFNSNYGTILTPRFMFKYNLDEETSLRGSLGSGFRTPEIFVENQNLFSSSKDLIFPSFIKGEKSVNWGISLTKEFHGSSSDIDIIIDYYSTHFTDQFIADFDISSDKVVFYNNSESSVTNSFQAEVNSKFINGLEAKISYNFLNATYNKNGVSQELPFYAKHKAMLSVTFETENKDWLFNINSQYFGKQKLPSTSSNPVEYQRGDYSDPFVMINNQVTFKTGFYEFYTGIENLLNYKQENPIISANNPFGRYFDTSFNWGPTKGREFYFGFRFKLN